MDHYIPQLVLYRTRKLNDSTKIVNGPLAPSGGLRASCFYLIIKNGEEVPDSNQRARPCVVIPLHPRLEGVTQTRGRKVGAGASGKNF